MLRGTVVFGKILKLFLVIVLFSFYINISYLILLELKKLANYSDFIAGIAQW
jgi:predicted Kef-type K+ transport protein